MTPLAIAIIWACFVSAVAIGAVFDLQKDANKWGRYIEGAAEIIADNANEISRHRATIRANPLTRHVLQGRDDKGRFTK